MPQGQGAHREQQAHRAILPRESHVQLNVERVNQQMAPSPSLQAHDYTFQTNITSTSCLVFGSADTPRTHLSSVMEWVVVQSPTFQLGLSALVPARPCTHSAEIGEPCGDVSRQVLHLSRVFTPTNSLRRPRKSSKIPALVARLSVKLQPSFIWEAAGQPSRRTSAKNVLCVMVARKVFPSVSSGQLQNIGRYSTTAPASLHYAFSGRSAADFRAHCRPIGLLLASP